MLVGISISTVWARTLATASARWAVPTRWKETASLGDLSGEPVDRLHRRDEVRVPTHGERVSRDLLAEELASPMLAGDQHRPGLNGGEPFAAVRLQVEAILPQQITQIIQIARIDVTDLGLRVARVAGPE